MGLVRGNLMEVQGKMVEKHSNTRHGIFLLLFELLGRVLGVGLDQAGWKVVVVGLVFIWAWVKLLLFFFGLMVVVDPVV